MRAFDEERDLLRLLDLLYEAAVRPERWVDFLEAFRSHVGAAFVNLQLRFYAPHERVIKVTSQGADPALQDLYRKHLFREDPYARLMPAPPGTVMYGPKDLPLRTILKTEYYNEYMRPQAFEEPVVAFIGNDVGVRAGGIGIVRGKGSPEWGAPLLRLIDRLVPHWQRAYEITSRLLEAEARRDAAEAALDRLALAVFLLDECGHLVGSNAPGRRLLDQRDGLLLGRGDVLQAADRRQDEELRRLVQDAAATSSGEGVGAGGVLVVHRPSGRPPLTVTVGPLRRELPELGGQAAVMVMVTDPADLPPGEDPGAPLRGVYRLTRAEANVVLLLVQGKAPKEIARETGRSLHTVRTQLKAAYTKMGVTRQAEVVRVAAELLGPAGGRLRPPT